MMQAHKNMCHPSASTSMSDRLRSCTSHQPPRQSGLTTVPGWLTVRTRTPLVALGISPLEGFAKAQPCWAFAFLRRTSSLPLLPLNKSRDCRRQQEGRFAGAKQWPGQSGAIREARFYTADQVTCRHTEPTSNAQDQCERWLALPALQFAVVRAVNVRQQGELILSDALTHPLCTDDFTEGRCSQWLKRCRAPRG